MRNVLIAAYLLGFGLALSGILLFATLITTLLNPAFLFWGGFGVSCYLFYLSTMGLVTMQAETRAQRLNPVPQDKPLPIIEDDDTKAPVPFNQDVLEVPSSRGHVEINGVRYPVTDYHITMRRQLYEDWRER